MNEHREKVTELFQKFENLTSRDDTYWDEVHRNLDYYPAQGSPVDEALVGEMKNQKGEFDILLVNYSDRNAFYTEVKTNYNDIGYGADQLDRARDHFDGDLQNEDEWAVIGDVILSNI